VARSVPDPRTGRVTSFRTQTDAKQFLVARVIEQATSEGVHLSDAERHMLSWSESDPDFTPDFDLAEAPEVAEAVFEPKMAALIRHAYDRDCRLNGQAALMYDEALAKLSEGDHYISVIVEQALE
jgi:hypothetical protein